MDKITAARVSKILWALVLVTLPVTSFRYMPFMGSGTYVRPLALYPLVILLPVLLFRLKKGEIPRPWPGSLTILLAFLLAAMAVTTLGGTFATIELRNVDYFDRAARAVVTLVIGLCFFIAAVWMNQDEADLKFSVRWVLTGLIAHLLWGAVQFIGLNTGHRKLLLEIQNLFSVRGLVKNKRISGFAYEPSWLAGQIVALYLPWLAAAVLMRYRAFIGGTGEDKKKFKDRFTPFIEPVLFLAGLLGLLMTYSRSGILIAFLAGAVTFALAGGDALAAFGKWVRAGFDRKLWTGTLPFLMSAGTRILLALLVMAVLAGAGIFLADKGYIAALFKSEKTDLISYAQDVYLGPRLAYAAAALTAFDTHPLTGTGLGASGFAIYPNIPDWALSGDPEIAKQMSPNSNLYPNSKNLYVRLLSETGLPGFMLFITFYLSLFADALALLRRYPASGAVSTSSNWHRWLAAAGIFSLSAIVMQGISQDSFAMPEIWVNLGMLAGASGAFLFVKSNPKKELP